MKRPRLRLFAVLLSVTMVAVVVGVLNLPARSRAPITTPEPTDSARQTQGPAGTSGPVPAASGSASNAAPAHASAASSESSAPAATASVTAPAKSLEDTIGTTQPVAGDANPSVRSVMSALQEKNHPERLSALVAPPPFDAEVYAADPVAYAQRVEPGRALQSAQPGPGVPVLRPLGTTQLRMPQDGRVILRLKTQPNAPVTFTSFDLGRFSNDLVSQTVIADAHGVAATEFFAGPGTIDAVHVLAASPVASGQVRFDIDVTPAAGSSSPAGG